MTDCTCNHFPANLDPVVFDTRVGIGIAPRQNLDVYGNITLERDSWTSGRIEFHAWHTNIRSLGAVGLIHTFWNADKFNIRSVSGTEESPTETDVFTILGNGNVGVGTTTPDSRLDVNGVLEVGTGSRGVILKSTVGDNFELFTHTNTPNPNLAIGYGNGAGALDTSKEYLSMNAGKIMLLNANVGIGKTDPAERLDVNGNIKLSGSLFAGTREVANANGCLYA